MISVSHDPDFPDEATARPRVTHHPVPQSGLTSAKINEWVHSESGTIYRIGEPLLRKLAGWHLERFFDLMNLENGLVVGALAVLFGGGLLLAATHQWWLTGFARLDYAHTTRLIVPAATLIGLGFQTAFFGFFTGIFGLPRK